jgi:hypothetical protein
VDCGVDKDTTGVLGIGNEVLIIAVLVASLRSQDGWATDTAVVRTFECSSVASVKSTREATQDLEVRLLVGSCHDSLAGGNVYAERLLAQNMLVGLNGADGLGSVLGCDSCNTDSFEARMFKHLIEVFVDLGAVWGEIRLCPGACIGIWVAGGYQLCTRSLLEEVAGVASAHAAEARDCYLELANHCTCWDRRRSVQLPVDRSGRRSDRKYVLEES